MGGGRKSGRGTPLFGLQPLLYYLMIPLKFHPYSFFRFIFMTYYVLKCFKMVDFYGFFVHNFCNYKSILPIFNTKQTLYKVNICANPLSATSIVLSTDRRTSLDRLRILPGPRIYIHVGVLDEYFNILQTE